MWGFLIFRLVYDFCPKIFVKSALGLGLAFSDMIVLTLRGWARPPTGMKFRFPRAGKDLTGGLTQKGWVVSCIWIAHISGDPW